MRQAKPERLVEPAKCPTSGRVYSRRDSVRGVQEPGRALLQRPLGAAPEVLPPESDVVPE